jgi:hypothetical protein
MTIIKVVEMEHPFFRPSSLGIKYVPKYASSRQLPPALMNHPLLETKKTSTKRKRKGLKQHLAKKGIKKKKKESKNKLTIKKKLGSKGKKKGKKQKKTLKITNQKKKQKIKKKKMKSAKSAKSKKSIDMRKLLKQSVFNQN